MSRKGSNKIVSTILFVLFHVNSRTLVIKLTGCRKSKSNIIKIY